MRNIFELTKQEQRVVIVIITFLVAFAFAKHWWQNATGPGSTKLKPVPAATSPSDQHENESTKDSGN